MAELRRFGNQDKQKLDSQLGASTASTVCASGHYKVELLADHLATERFVIECNSGGAHSSKAHLRLYVEMMLTISNPVAPAAAGAAAQTRNGFVLCYDGGAPSNSLQLTGGNIVRAAQALGLSSRYALYRLMRKHGIEPGGARPGNHALGPIGGGMMSRRTPVALLAWIRSDDGTRALATRITTEVRATVCPLSGDTEGIQDSAFISKPEHLAWLADQDAHTNDDFGHRSV